MKQFEYLIIKLSDMSIKFGKHISLEQDLLNKMGEQGWELVHISPTNFFGDGLYYFKRAKD